MSSIHALVSGGPCNRTVTYPRAHAARNDLAHVHLRWFGPEDEGKTEDPTEYRIKKAREEGRVAKSQDLVGALGLLLPTLALSVFAPWMTTTLRDMTSYFLGISTQIDPASEMGVLGMAFLSYFARLTLPIAIVAFIAAVFSNLVQVGFLFTTKPLKPDFKRALPNFPQYFKRTGFSGEGLFNMAKSVIKIVLIGIIGYTNIAAVLPKLTRLQSATVLSSTALVASTALRILLQAAILLLALAVPDYLFQKRQFRKNMKMTKQEIKEEHKMFEGDPRVKGRIRERMREIMSRNMVANVPKADVLVTNPTHFAVAIEFDPRVMAVPVVSAKGADELALRMRQAAKEAGVTTIENKPLARALYAASEVGDPVPEQYYEAIAKLLAYVATIDQKVAKKLASA